MKRNLPQVLMIMVKSYLAMGAKSDMNYFMDILVSEHPESPFTKRAILLFADSLFNKKEKDKNEALFGCLVQRERFGTLRQRLPFV